MKYEDKQILMTTCNIFDIIMCITFSILLCIDIIFYNNVGIVLDAIALAFVVIKEIRGQYLLRQTRLDVCGSNKCPNCKRVLDVVGIPKNNNDYEYEFVGVVCNCGYEKYDNGVN